MGPTKVPELPSPQGRAMTKLGWNTAGKRLHGAGQSEQSCSSQYLRRKEILYCRDPFCTYTLTPKHCSSFSPKPLLEHPGLSQGDQSPPSQLMLNKGTGSGQLIFHQGRGRGLWGKSHRANFPETTHTQVNILLGKSSFSPVSPQHVLRKGEYVGSFFFFLNINLFILIAHRVLLESRRQFARAAIMQPRMSNEALGLRPKAEANQEDEVLPQHESSPAARAISLRAEVTGAVGHATPKES